MKQTRGSIDLFDRTAEEFARGTDELIQGGSYVRGRLFLEMTQRYVRPGGRILDYGCGPGRIALSLAQNGFKVVGVDQSPGMIGAARKIAGPSLPVEFHEIGGFPDLFLPSVWDGIVCSSVIEYIEDPGATLRAFFAALKPGGVLILSYANARTLWRLVTLARSRSHPHLNFQYNVWGAREARRALRAAGFRVLSGPRFFESPFDKKGLPFLSRSRFIGTLGLVVLGKPK